jgi:hypothetical protein
MITWERQRLATWILTRCTSDYRRDSFIGDLMEQYEERGGWWYWRQVLGAVRAHSHRLLLTAAESDVAATEYIGDLILWIALGMYGVIQVSVYAMLLIGSMLPIRSNSSILAVGAMIFVALLGAATAVHEIRMRTARPI